MAGPNWQRFNFRHLLLFCELGRLGSIRELSRVHRVDASLVSRIVAGFEREYGARLLERSTQGVRFTERGLEVKIQFEGVLAVARQRLADVTAARKPMAIASTAFLTTRAVAPTVARLNSADPSLSIRLVDFSPDELVAVGIQGAFDGAVHIDRLDWPRAWTTAPAGHIAFQLFCRSAHPLAARGPVKPTDLADFAFTQPVYWSRGGLGFGNDHCPLPRDQRRGGTSTSTADAAVSIVRHSDEVAFLPEILCREDLERGVLCALQVKGWPAVQKPLHASFRSDAVSARFFKSFVAGLKRVVRP